MNRKPQISICITTCDRPKALKRLIDSINRQTFKDYEIIITDDSEQACEDYQEWSSKIRYFWNPERLGQSGNMNRAISEARGVYIKPMHDDDWFTYHDSLEQFYQLLKVKGTSFAFSGSADEQCDGSQLIRYVRHHEARLLKNNWKQLFQYVGIGAPSVAIWKAKGNWRCDERLKDIVDVDLFASILSSHVEFAYTQKPLVTIGNVMFDAEKKHNTHEFCDNMKLRREECRIVCEKYWGGNSDFIKRNYIARLMKNTNAADADIKAAGLSLFEYRLQNRWNAIYVFIWRCIYYIGRRLKCD